MPSGLVNLGLDLRGGVPEQLRTVVAVPVLVTGSKDLEEAGQVAARVSLVDCAKDITCPIYILAGTKDRLTGVDQASKLAAAIICPA